MNALYKNADRTFLPYPKSTKLVSTRFSSVIIHAVVNLLLELPEQEVLGDVLGNLKKGLYKFIDI